MMPGWGWGGMGFGGGLLGFLFMILFWGVLIAGVVLAVRWLTEKSRSGEGRQEDSALEILKKRYARGEIGKEEFEEKKKDLL
ncbi:MAG: SHOCT domain-containing protein [Candidatus Tectomicrobia bacterium]|uniref:SHOCT domain-containing protein n=1 Tax=Tectimicrobiota bacterium TaxID=2528274 RepID=A0A932GRP6_UNCTE|nr:SHOCT domain-containing protein [Candidatus Tectomicrobia bacterium]